MRLGKKMGHPQAEIQPSISANMLAKDPFESAEPSTENIASNDKLRPRRLRGRPKSRKVLQKENTSMDPSVEELVAERKMALQSFDSIETSEFQQLDFDDAASVSSEKERKFWESDPSKLQVDPLENIMDEDWQPEQSQMESEVSSNADDDDDCDEDW